MIEVEHLTKDYGTVVALADVSFRVGSGEVVGFLGPNGAGKSTTLRILAGFLGATSGRVSVAGHDVAREPLAAKRQLGYMPETAPLYPELRVNEYLGFRASLKGIARRARRDAVALAMERAAVSEVADTLIGHLSKGFRQRVALADAIVATPPLLILDEPTAGLDPNQIRDVRALIRELGKKHTILLSTHILSEVEATCDRALVIHRGRLVAEGSLAELGALGRAKTLALELVDPDAKAEGIAGALPGVESTQVELLSDGARRLSLTLARSPAEIAEELVSALVLAGVRVRSVVPGKASLEEVFASLTETPRAAPSEGTES